MKNQALEVTEITIWRKKKNDQSTLSSSKYSVSIQISGETSRKRKNTRLSFYSGQILSQHGDQEQHIFKGAENLAEMTT